MKALFFRAFCLFSLATISLCFADEVEATEEVLSLIEEQNQAAAGLLAAVDNLGPTAGGFVSEGNFGQQDDELSDPKVLRNFVENYGLIQARKQDGTLIIAGDVRARWSAIREKSCGRFFPENSKEILPTFIRFSPVRGSGTNTATNLFKGEANLILDYTAPRSWVTVKVRWSDFLGTDGGSSTRVDLDRAFLGYDIYNEGDLDFYAEVGRTRLDYLFDSNIEFGSVFDGLHLSFTNNYPCIGQFFVHGGPFIIDPYTNHYACAAEIGVVGIADSNFGVKYSIVNWRKLGVTLNYGNLPNSGNINITDNPRYRFVVSQLLLEYDTICPFILDKSLYCYGAGLINSVARPSPTTNFRRANLGWYAGVTIGDLVKALDWSLDINYQYVQAQAVPEFDLSGVGHGNALNLFLSDAIIGTYPSNLAQGFANYKGIQCALFYAVTDSLSFKAKFEFTRPISKSIGGNFVYRNCELAGIYAF